MPTRHIVALGGGGFSMEDAPDLDDYILGLARREARGGANERPRLLFVPTASGDSIDYMTRFYRAFEGRAEARTLTLFRRDRDLEALVEWADVVYVGGGNTANMMAVWRLHGVDVLLRRAYERGAVMAGVSAGALCWFESGVTDSFGPLRPIESTPESTPESPPDGCLGWLPGSFCPHFDGDPERRPTYARLVDGGRLPAGYGVDDSAGLHFRDEALVAVVRSTATAGAYRVASGDVSPIDP